MPARRFRVEWPTELGYLVAVEPALEVVRAQAGELAARTTSRNNGR